MNDWIAQAQRIAGAGHALVRMVVAQVRGSAPREAGAAMLFWRDAQGCARIDGSIGGGHLEARAMHIAEHLLAAAPAARRVERFILGASLGQCCGGVVELYWERLDLQCLEDLGRAQTAPGAAPLRYCLLDGSGDQWLVDADAAQAAGLPPAQFPGRAGLLQQGTQRYFAERLDVRDTDLWLYGAGHVGRALVHVLADLPFRIRWVDSREAVLDEAMARLPTHRGGVRPLAEEADIAAQVAPRGAWHVVMTHLHELDLRVCEAVLETGGSGFLGLLGSHTKATRFRRRLLQRGYSPSDVAGLACPIGSGTTASKLPAAIAVAVAAQLLRQRDVAATRMVEVVGAGAAVQAWAVES